MISKNQKYLLAAIIGIVGIVLIGLSTKSIVVPFGVFCCICGNNIGNSVKYDD